MFKRWVAPALLAAGLLGSTLTAAAASGHSTRLLGSEGARGPELVQAAGPATVKVITTASGGTMLADSAGRSLYLFTRDERNKSNCMDGCLRAWPPLLTDGAPMAGEGVMADRLGSITRSDGSMQVTYNGWPLYYFVNDAQPGEIKGQNVNNVWFVVSPYGGPRQTGAQVKAMAHPTLGTILTDASGRTLYLFTRDEMHKSNCAGTCALNWPPVLSIGPAKADMGAEGQRLALMNREEGSSHVTYNGMPLYYFAGDEKPGDVKGQGANNVWYAVSPAGQMVRTSAAPVAPAALPRTGDGLAGLLLAMSGAMGGLLTVGGLWLRQRAA